MKKITLCLLAIGVLAVSCSRQNVEVPEVDPETAWVNDLSLPVPIRFASSSINTKAFVDEAKFSALNNIGIFAVQPKYGTEYPAWTVADLDLLEGTILLDNELAHINKNSMIEFTNGTKYYPIISTHHFSFYAYWPREEAKGKYGQDDFVAGYYSKAAAGTGTEEGYRVVYDLSANAYGLDILWAESKAIDPITFNNRFGTDGEYRGFNARYLRTIETVVNTFPDDLIDDKYAESSKPSLAFTHCLTALSFKTQLNKQGGKNPWIQKVVLKNVAKKVELTVVDNKINIDYKGKYTGNAGTVRAVTAGEDPFEDIDIVPVKAVEVTEEGGFINDLPFIILPDESYVIDIYYSENEDDKESEWFVSEDNVIKQDSDSSFLAGHHYTVVIQLNGFLGIDITASLTPWKNVEISLPLE